MKKVLLHCAQQIPKAVIKIYHCWANRTEQDVYSAMWPHHHMPCNHIIIGLAQIVTSGWGQQQTRHRASTTTYSLTFRVRVTTPSQYGRNGTAHAAGASILSPARGVFAGMRSVCVRHACGGPDGLSLGSAMHFHNVAIATQPVHRLQIRQIVHN